MLRLTGPFVAGQVGPVDRRRRVGDQQRVAADGDAVRNSQGHSVWPIAAVLVRPGHDAGGRHAGAARRHGNAAGARGVVAPVDRGRVGLTDAANREAGIAEGRADVDRNAGTRWDVGSRNDRRRDVGHRHRERAADGRRLVGLLDGNGDSIDAGLAVSVAVEDTPGVGRGHGGVQVRIGVDRGTVAPVDGGRVAYRAPRSR